MPTTRMIDPQIWASENISKLTIRQRLLFIGLFSNADDQGRIRANPALVRSRVFPYDEIAADEIAADLKAIEDIQSIKLYADNGTAVLQILGWWKYQHPQWAYPSNIAPPDGWHDRLRYRKGERQVVTSNWDGALPNQLPNQTANQLPIAQGGAIELGLEVGLEVVNSVGAQNAPATSETTNATDTTKSNSKHKRIATEPKQPRKRDELFDAIVSVCCIDPATAGASVGKVRATLSATEPPYTAAEVEAFGAWWNKDEWRSKKGPPTLWKLQEQIGIVRNGNGNKPKPTEKPSVVYQ